MTPQLQQAIKLLQLSNVELAAYVEDQVEKNPLLEVEERSGASDNNVTGTSERTQDAENAQDFNGSETEGVSQLAAADRAISEDRTTAAAESSIDADYDNLYADDLRADRQNEQSVPGGTSLTDWSNVRGGSSKFESEGADIEATLASQPTLREHLIEQLNVGIKDVTERAIGLHLIDTIDEAGYLREEVANIAERLGTRSEVIESVLAKLQAFEPVGIFCRNLAECLALQLAEKDRLDPAMRCLIDNLNLLAKHDQAALDANLRRRGR